jgi:hypothetical protein
MNVPPAVVDEDSEIGQRYIAAMELAGRYAYAGAEKGPARSRKKAPRAQKNPSAIEAFFVTIRRRGGGLFQRPERDRSATLRLMFGMSISSWNVPRSSCHRGDVTALR